MSRTEWTKFVDELNERLKKLRTKGVDFGLLFGLQIVGMVPFLYRRKGRAKARHRVFEEAAEDFNARFNPGGAESIEMVYNRSADNMHDARLKIFIVNDIAPQAQRVVVHRAKA